MIRMQPMPFIVALVFALSIGLGCARTVQRDQAPAPSVPVVEPAGPERAVQPEASQPAQPAQGSGKPCKVTGCSGTVCAEQDEQEVSICQWKEEYACYRGARCERQADGPCGWTMTAKLRRCLGGRRAR